MSADPAGRRQPLGLIGHHDDDKSRKFNKPDLEFFQPLAKRHLVYQCSICGRKHVRWRTDGCSCCAENLMHGITVDEKEWLRLLAND